MKKAYLSIFLIILVVLASCTKHFSDINTNITGGKGAGASSAVEDASSFLPSIMGYIYPSDGGPNGTAGWVYQVQQNFNSDIFSGYWMMAGGFGHGSSVESNDYLVQGWDDYLYASWANIIAPFATIQSSAWAYPNAINLATYGMALTSKVMISVRVADAEGTLPYTSPGSSDNPYDSLGKVYDAFFSELDSANSYLSKNSSSAVGANDYFYTGNIAKWITLTNSLRLELAMRIVKVNPELARAQAEKAMSTGDLITNNSQNAAYINAQIGALTTLNYIWGVGNTIPGADVYSYLAGYKDPRLTIFLSPTNSSNTSSRDSIGSYCTMRLGSVAVPGDTKLSATMFSLPGSGIPQSGTCNGFPEASTFFNAAETNFLLAEAALRGWNMGTYTQNAENYYDLGVQASMNQWGVSVGNYLNTTAKPADYTDPTLADRDIKAVSTCSPKWSDASTNEGHLEQIITQKWIALWPVNSPVAWSEYRRTGYPKLFPAYMSAVPPTISWGGLTVNNARKIMLPNNEYLTNAANVYDAINDYLGGTDDITTHVWWDVDKPNF
ncbi:MAG TPA: SusD/RagB family nutrient-binding outer membrane lipoprotein [Arachidicoccus sp.]